MASLADSVLLGLATALSLENLLYCMLGVTLGTLLGVLPGIGTLAALALLFPLTFHLDPLPGLIMLAGIYYGTTYGGSTASILLNLPGTPSNAVVCLDGYPMTRQGRAGVALFMTTIASFVGGTVGIVAMMLFAPVIAAYALAFGPAEYFSLMVLGLIAAATISQGQAAKGIGMILFGIALGLVGTDVNTGMQRFTFGTVELADGISLLAVAMGMVGLAEAIASIRTLDRSGTGRQSIRFRSMMPTRDDIRRSWLPMARGSGIGAFFGTLPGTGGMIASFMAYAVEKKVAAEPERFGKGAIEGIMAPETANNAADQTAFIPTMTLGIPGTAPMAILLSVLIIHGISPGPTLITVRPDIFWGLVMSFWLGNIMLLVINIPMIGLWVRLLQIPYHLLYPAILFFIAIGVYSVNYSAFNVGVVICFGAIGYAMRLLELPPAPMILGFVLGPMMEENFRRAALIARGDLTVFLSRPISCTLLVLSLALLVWSATSWRSTRLAAGRVQAAATVRPVIEETRKD